MAKARKTLSIRVDADDYSFLNQLAAQEREDISKAVRDLGGRGRVMLAVERYRAGKAALGKAAEIAGLSINETLDVLVQYGVPANLDSDDYLQSLANPRETW